MISHGKLSPCIAIATMLSVDKSHSLHMRYHETFHSPSSREISRSDLGDKSKKVTVNP